MFNRSSTRWSRNYKQHQLHHFISKLYMSAVLKKYVSILVVLFYLFRVKKLTKRVSMRTVFFGSIEFISIWMKLKANTVEPQSYVPLGK